MILQDDNHPFCAATVDGVGDRARVFCADDVCEGDDDCGDDDDGEVWLAVARLGRLTGRPGVAFLAEDAGTFFADFLVDAAGVTADLGFLAVRVGVRDRDLARLAGDAFFAVDFLADRAGVDFLAGVEGVDEVEGLDAALLAGVFAMMINLVSRF